MPLPLVVRLYIRRADIRPAPALKIGLAGALGLRDPAADGSASEAASIVLLGFGLLAQRHCILLKGLDLAASTALYEAGRRGHGAFGTGTAVFSRFS